MQARIKLLNAKIFLISSMSKNNVIYVGNMAVYEPRVFRLILTKLLKMKKFDFFD